MKRTENYKLPQIELEDNYDIEHFNDGWRKTDEELKRIDDEVKKRVNYDDTEIRNMICDTNASLDNKANKSEVDNNINELDVKIAENKSLTDSEISKLKEIANTWETFKNSGGDIGGAINFPLNSKINNITKPITITNNTMYYRENVTNNAGFSHISRFEDDSLGDKVNQNGIEFRKNYGETSGAFRPIVDNALDLGSSNYKWKDIYLNGVSKSNNGYTKLPNGLIMQWGFGSATGQYANNGTPFKSANINFPISFPNSTLIVQTCSTFTNYYSTVESVTTSKFVARMGLTGNTHTQETTTFYWIAIGY